MINRQVTENAPARMAADKNYTSDSVDSYREAAQSMPAFGNMNDAQITDIAEDAYLSTHCEQLVREAAELQDEALANGSELSEKDALTTAFAGKHNDSTAVSPDGTYTSADQGHKNKIDALQRTQKQNGNTVTSARLENYGKIARSAGTFKSGEQFKGVPEVQAHTAAAAQAHGRTYDPFVSASAESIDFYQGNMSAALAHKDEIVEHAQDYLEEQKQAGNKSMTMEQAVSHVVMNEQDYDMSYGFEQSYADDIAETLIASDIIQSKPSSDASRQSHRSKIIAGNSSVNEKLGREKQSHNRPGSSLIESAKRGYNSGKNLGRKKKK